jgi:hypothetical protein
VSHIFVGKEQSANLVKVEPVVHREVRKYQSVNLNEYLHRLEGDVKAYVTQLPEEKYVWHFSYLIFLASVVHSQCCL